MVMHGEPWERVGCCQVELAQYVLRDIPQMTLVWVINIWTILIKERIFISLVYVLYNYLSCVLHNFTPSPLTHTAGMRHPVAEGRLSTIDIPKGTSDLGIGISWCEDQVRQISTINVQYIYARVSVTLNSDECAMSTRLCIDL